MYRYTVYTIPMFLVAKFQVGSKGNYLIIIIYVFYIDDNILLIQS